MWASRALSKLKTWTVLGRIDAHAAPEASEEAKKPAKAKKSKDAEAPAEQEAEPAEVEA